MKFKLGNLENNRTFYTPKGTQTLIRDVTINQTELSTPPPPIIEIIEPVIEEIKEKLEAPVEQNQKRNKQ
jgi:hypothetical protein